MIKVIGQVILYVHLNGNQKTWRSVQQWVIDCRRS